jgi:hypothetical protein
MLERECPFANGDKSSQINRIRTESKVLLCANQKGIIAVGIATPEKRNIPWGDDDSGRYVKLREFRKLKPPFSVASIKKIAGKNCSFLHTLTKLQEQIGEKIWKDCIDMT